MKNNKHILRIAVLSTVFALGIGLTTYFTAAHKEVNAYSGTSPTTDIDLNDYSEQEIRDYYSDLNSLTASERQGTNLLKHLKGILKTDQKYLNYDSGDNIWNLYEITDRDWVKSPASSISHGTYNPNTNKITNYQYGSSGDNPYVHALYVNRNVNNQTRAWGDHSQKNWGINREHIWAKSHGFQASGAGGARGDPMHLWAGNGYANNIHNDYFFGFVDKSKTYTDCGNEYSYLRGNLKGKSLNGNNDSKDVFEPQDCDKGDIARAVFYMVARYNNYAGNDNSIDTNNPNLALTNDLSKYSEKGTSTSSKAYSMGLLSDLLAWNKLDPVDEYEIHRNNLLHRNFTNNRNPFIDFPNWADAIWGTADLDGKNYNPSITTYASPATDSISESTVSSVFSISYSSLTMQENETADIIARNAKSSINWTVDDNTIVSLNKATSSNDEAITITALASGTTTITATSGSDSATCTITVNEASSQQEGDTLFTADLTDGASVSDGYIINYGYTSNKSDYFQDGSTVGNQTHFVVRKDSPLFTSVPNKITFTANLSAGNAVDELGNNVEVCLVDQNGDDIESTRRTLTTRITTSVTEYSVELPYSADAYGAKIYHVKTSGYNIRFFSFALSCEGSTPVLPEPEDYLGNVTRISGLYGDSSTDTGFASSSSDINFVSIGLTNGQAITNIDLGNSVILDGDKGTNNNAPKFYTSDNTVRFYSGNAFTFQSSDTITEIAFTIYSGDISDITASTGTINGNTWTGSTTSVTFTNGGTAQFRITDVQITRLIEQEIISVSNLAFKFGVVIPQDDWDAITDNWEISNYGFMIVKENTLVNNYHKDTVEEAYIAGDRLQDLHRGDGDTPYSFDNNYLFTVKLNIGNNIAHNLRFCASPYIVINDVYYFLGEIRCSINELANDCLTSGETNLPDNALTYLKTQ